MIDDKMAVEWSASVSKTRNGRFESVQRDFEPECLPCSGDEECFEVMQTVQHDHACMDRTTSNLSPPF